MLEDPEVDVVGIAVLDDGQIASAEAKAGKHIQFEHHPFDASSGLELLATVQRANVMTNVAYLHLANPSIVLLRELLSARKLGILLHARARVTASDASTCISEGLRQGPDRRPEVKSVLQGVLAIARKVIGEIASVRVQGLSGKHQGPRLEFDFERGLKGTIEVCDGFVGNSPSFQLEIDGTGGTVAFDSHEPGTLKFQKKIDGKPSGKPTTSYPAALHLPKNAHWEFRSPNFDGVELKTIEIASFLENGQSDIRMAADLSDARRLQDLLNAASAMSTPHPFGI